MLHIKAGSKHAEVEPSRHGEEESSGAAVASVVKLMGLVRLAGAGQATVMLDHPQQDT